MPTYYEILKVQPTASHSEIQTAIDAQYNQFRRLVTHHDPNVVEGSNRSLRILETIRGALLNLEERAKYDAGLSIGGLADPEQLLRAAMPTPVSGPLQDSIPKQARVQASVDRVDAWVCQACRKANPIGEKFCAQCGKPIADDCPQCGKLTELSKPFCSKCGADKPVIIQQKALEKIKSFRFDIEKNANEINEIRKLSGKIPFWGSDKKNPILHSQIFDTHFGCGSGFLAVVFLITGMFWGGGAIGFDNSMAPVGMLVGLVTGWFLFGFLFLNYRKYTGAAKNATRMVAERQAQIAELEKQIRALQMGSGSEY